MKRLQTILVISAATYFLLAGHEALARVFCRMLAERGVVAAQRQASPLAAIVMHAVAGIFVLPGLAALRRRLPAPDVQKVALWTAIIAIGVRATFEAASGVLVQGLPLAVMAVGAAALPALAITPRHIRRPRLRFVVHGRAALRDVDHAA